MAPASITAIDVLLDTLGQAFDRKSWHGPNLKGSLRGVSATEALWRPARARHNIWELAVHAAYWKYAVRRRLTGEERNSFAKKGSNWFPAGKTDAEWRADVAILADQHRRLIDAVTAFDPRRLGETPHGSRFPFHALITGAAAHDLYHTGQIRLLKKMRE